MLPLSLFDPRAGLLPFLLRSISGILYSAFFVSIYAICGVLSSTLIRIYYGGLKALRIVVYKDYMGVYIDYTLSGAALCPLFSVRGVLFPLFAGAGSDLFCPRTGGRGRGRRGGSAPEIPIPDLILRFSQIPLWRSFLTPWRIFSGLWRSFFGSRFF